MLKWKVITIPNLVNLNLEDEYISQRIVYNTILSKDVQKYLKRNFLPEVWRIIDRKATAIEKICLAQKLYLFYLINWKERGCGVPVRNYYGIWCGECYDCKMNNIPAQKNITVDSQKRMIAKILLDTHEEFEKTITCGIKSTSEYEYPTLIYGPNRDFAPLFTSMADNLSSIINLSLVRGDFVKANSVAESIDRLGMWCNTIIFLTTSLEVANIHTEVLVWSILRCLIYFIWNDVQDYGYFIKTKFQTDNKRLLEAFECWKNTTGCQFYDGKTLSVPTHFTIIDTSKSKLYDRLKNNKKICDFTTVPTFQEHNDIEDLIYDIYWEVEQEWLVNPILKIFPELKGSI